MRKDTYNKLLGLGFDTELIDKFAGKGFTFSTLKGFSKKQLQLQEFTAEEADFIIKKVNRQPIDTVVIEALIDKSGGICCYCSDGVNSRPYQIHHIEEYHKTQDNSETNLMIVCPTHHSVIHTNHIDIATQNIKKARWEALWEVARIYHEKGLAFPFGAIEPIDYTIPGSITDVFNFASPLPAVCKLLVTGSAAQEGTRILTNRHQLILAGTSGSGKTTLATGIAGNVEGHYVYKYVAAGNDGRTSAQEILTFFSEATKKIILIVDDANTILRPVQIELLLQAAGPENKIIIVNTRNSLTSEGNFEQHFSDAVMTISWNEMKDVVCRNMLSYESEVVQYLRDNNLAEFHGNRIGFGMMDTKLNSALPHVAQEVNTVWEFIFTLASGLEKIFKLRSEHFANDRLDILVLFIGVNQIARVEEGTTIEELLDLYSWHPALNSSPAPTREWLAEKLSQLISVRLLKITRGRYNTVHRQFAAKYIDACFAPGGDDVSIILHRYFSDTGKIKENLILWSWLSDLMARDILNRWIRSLDVLQWTEMGNAAAAHSFAIFASYIDRLHIGTNRAKQAIPAILQNNLDKIAAYVNEPDKNMFYYFDKCSVGFRYHAKDLWMPLLRKINLTELHDTLLKATPADIRHVGGVFYGITEVNPRWVIDFAGSFSMQDFWKIAEQVSAGDVKELSEQASFIRRYIGNFKKSDFDFFADQICRLLKDAPISSWRFHPLFAGLEELKYHERLNRKIASAINADQFRSDLCELTPHYWEIPFSLLLFLSDASYDIIQQWLEEVDIQRLIENITSYGSGNIRGKRLLYATFVFASDQKLLEITKAMYPLVREAVVSGKPYDEHDRFLELLNRVDKEAAKRICDELGVQVKADSGGGNWSLTTEEAQELVNEIESKELSGADYTLRNYLLTLDNLPRNRE